MSLFFQMFHTCFLARAGATAVCGVLTPPHCYQGQVGVIPAMTPKANWLKQNDARSILHRNMCSKHNALEMIIYCYKLYIPRVCDNAKH
jgi:hypothetical protein